jgi:hypothetical protein
MSSSTTSLSDLESGYLDLPAIHPTHTTPCTEDDFLAVSCCEIPGKCPIGCRGLGIVMIKGFNYNELLKKKLLSTVTDGFIKPGPLTSREHANNFKQLFSLWSSENKSKCKDDSCPHKHDGSECQHCGSLCENGSCPHACQL